MSDPFKWAKKQWDSVRKAVGAKPGKAPEVQAPPTVDDAQKNLQETDRLVRRKGVLANIFAGTNGGAPQVGKSKLGG